MTSGAVKTGYIILVLTLVTATSLINDRAVRIASAIALNTGVAVVVLSVARKRIRHIICLRKWKL